jgi:hypothetical protein
MMFVRTRKRGRPHMRWRDKFKKDLNIKGIRNTGRQWSQMNGGCIGSQVPQQIVVLKEEEEEE